MELKTLQRIEPFAYQLRQKFTKQKVLHIELVQSWPYLIPLVRF